MKIHAVPIEAYRQTAGVASKKNQAPTQEQAGLQRADRPDVVFLDVQMPGSDGLQALDRIRAREPDLPVIVMTAYGTVKTAMEAMRLGAFDYLGKPIELSQIRSLLDMQAKRNTDRGVLCWLS